jgi:cobalt-zinc-cadmium resistance protein CzcA
MTAIQFGVGIPLFFWTQRGKAQAAKTGREVARAQYDSKLMMQASLYQTKSQEVDKYLQSVRWYESQGLQTSEELLRFTNQGYSSGEIDYVEYINAVNQALAIRIEYAEALNNYNQAVIDLQYLAGSF